MREVRPGVWRWSAPHPDWSPGAKWPQVVSSTAIEDADRLVLIDPLAVPAELLARAGERPMVIVLTAPWHERDARTLIATHGFSLFTPRPDSAQDLMAKFDITAEQAGDGSPDLRWVREEAVEATFYGADGIPELGIEAFPGREPNDLVLWVERVGAVVAGDSLADWGDGLAIRNEWLSARTPRPAVIAALRPLLGKPVEIVLPAHGAEADRAALERALA